MANTFGHSLTITSFGESHGSAIGVVLDGLPSNFELDLKFIQSELDRRKPGQSSISTQRQESDEFEIISGLFDGKTTGTPICIVIQNTDQRSKDYSDLKDIYRPGHADQSYDLKYKHRDYRGGGRSSARLTAPWVAAGAIAKQFLKEKFNISIQSVVSAIHNVSVPKIFETDWSNSESNIVRCPDNSKAREMVELIEHVRTSGDSVGGIVSTKVINCPPGLGEPLFDKLNADIAKAIFSINAVKGLEFGSGFAAIGMKGSEHNDTPESNSNHEGGISGGISTGKNIEFNTAFKPVSSIAIAQKAYDSQGGISELNIKGRHDPCVVPRAVPIVEAMTALVIADHILLNLKYDKL